MEKALYAADYAKHCGLDLKLVKRLCKKGIIPHLRNGAFYCIWPDKADVALEKYVNQNMEKLQTEDKELQQKEIQKPCKPALSIKNGNEFLETINKLLKGNKSA